MQLIIRLGTNLYSKEVASGWERAGFEAGIAAEFIPEDIWLRSALNKDAKFKELKSD